MVGWGRVGSAGNHPATISSGTFFLAAWGDRKNEQWGRSTLFEWNP